MCMVMGKFRQLQAEKARAADQGLRRVKSLREMMSEPKPRSLLGLEKSICEGPGLKESLVYLRVQSKPRRLDKESQGRAG